ncbi:hypothetical protein Mpet_0809 [Methanolacinia petrolearia DSM 11571]|uniref:Uncharacterized protein n=1 Tax=Methanolacinia petrolearia (strain DSM 11571 / OCM 486 / SEBR 4847) TaxID=679926 RepID=E1RIZ4_METP4|nr:hypothetical protein [Methanolacinia petrolearia]ADN35582.1 hypothetical protein Mpet_0809 [Methanolacinia petrolearia DSM 11571]
MDFVVGISNGLLDFVMNSLILTSIVFAALSVLVYLVLTRIKDERIQLFIGIAGGFLLLAIPVFPAGGLTGSAVSVTGAVLVMISPVIVFRGYLDKKDILPAVFLVALTYPADFRTTWYMCDFVYPGLWNIGDFLGPLILSLSTTALLVFLRRYYENFKHERRLLIPLLLLIPGIIWFAVPVAAASLSALMFISFNELHKGVHKIPDIQVLVVMIFAALISILPWPFLASLPCVRNIFPLWILPVLAVSLVSAASVYYLRSKFSERWIEVSVFVLGFALAVLLSTATILSAG